MKQWVRGRLQGFPTLYLDFQLWRWRLVCLKRIVAKWFDWDADGLAREVVGVLRREGIAVLQVDRLFGEDRDLFRQVVSCGYELLAQARSMAAREGEGALRRLAVRDSKDFKAELVPDTLRMDHPFVRLALNPHLLAIANRYMGMRTYLRAISLHWDRPTADPPKSSQQWHKDLDDVLNLKVFIYFNDVTLSNGPFCFIPRSHPLGNRRVPNPAWDVKSHVSDDDMAKTVPPLEWRVCTGSAGTVILCDTCGYHRGLKPGEGDRLMLMFQYTSGCTPARKMRTFQLDRETNGALRPAQRWAVELFPLSASAGVGA